MERGPHPNTNTESRVDKTQAQFEFNQSLKKDLGDIIAFTDPLTGERITDNKPPEFLLQDPSLKSGYEFLKQHASRLKLELILAEHHPDRPEDLGDTDFNFEGKVRNADVLLLEGLGWNQEYKSLLNRISSNETESGDQEKLEEFVHDPYTLRIIETIHDSKISIGFYDIENTDGPTDIQQKLIGNTDFLAKIADAKMSEEIDEDKIQFTRDLAMNAQIVAFEAMREWYMICGTGQQIEAAMREHPELEVKLEAGDLRVVILSGASHQDLVRKFKEIGTDPVSGFARNDVISESSNLQKAIPTWIAKGEIDKEELKRLTAL